MVSDDKLSFFLTDYVDKTGNKHRRNFDGSPAPLSKESINQYVKAVAALGTAQQVSWL